MRVVVVGGGFGGLASALRLAKLGHAVTLVESSRCLGGALGSVSEDGFRWDSGPSWTLLPAVLRDLFRKSGRPLEREVDLVPLELVREHRFEDGSVLALPAGSRAAQTSAVDALGPGLGSQWTAYADGLSGTWELLRREVLERPWHPASAPRELARLLRSRETLATRTRKALRDPRLRLVATHDVTADGHEPRAVPAWVGVTAYLQQRMGLWTAAGGLAGVGEALERRLTTRGVTVLTAVAATDVIVRGGRARGVATTEGVVDADAVVCAVDPRRLPALAVHVRRGRPALPPRVCHLGLDDNDARLTSGAAREIVLHGDPLLVVRVGGQAPEGAAAWTVHSRGRPAEDLLLALARAGLDVRDRVVVRIDRSPEELVERWGGSPLGLRWEGRRTLADRVGPTTPVPGLYAAGAYATPLPGLPFVGLSAALVAQLIGPAGDHPGA